MPRGPLPKPAAQRRRRNTPTIPSTKLPVSGRKGRAPGVPEWATLGAKGTAFWKWAWSTPQAVAWDEGSHVSLVRRAMLEDDLAALESIDFGPIPTDDDEALALYLDGIKYLCARLRALAGGQISVMREARELDDRLGLNPKAIAALRWTIVPDDDDAESGPPKKATDEVGKRREERKQRLAAGS